MACVCDEVKMNNLRTDVLKIVETRMQMAMTDIISDIERLIRMQFQQSSVPRREMELQFINKISPTILTGEEIKGEVILVDTCTGHVVDTGPEASATVEILALKGGESDDACEGDNWFIDNIVQAEFGKLPLLAGNVRVNLERGHGVVDGIKFRNHSVKMDIPPVFRLGARAVDSFQGTQVKKATTQVFTVKDFRNKYIQKHDVPSLRDEVWRLQNIQKGGKNDERLCGANISTVEDFLIRLLKNPQELESIVKLPPTKWKALVNHARTCSIDQRRYCYINFQQKTGIVFDLLGNVLGLILKGRYTPTNILSRQDQARIDELLAAARESWEETKCFFEEEKLQDYLIGEAVAVLADPSSSFRPECTSLQLCDKPVGPSELIDEYGCTQMMNSSLPDPHNKSNPSETGGAGEYSSVQMNLSHGLQIQPSAEGGVDMDHMEIEPDDHWSELQDTGLGYQQSAGPSWAVDECIYQDLEELFPDVGLPSTEQISYVPTLDQHGLQNSPGLSAEFDYDYIMQLVTEMDRNTGG